MTNYQERLREGTISFFFLGKSPVAPGTFGSLGALIVAYSLILLIGDIAGILILILAALFYYMGIQIAPWCEKKYGKDPGIFVLDEVIGYLLVIGILIIFQIEINSYLWIISFIMFRVFDVLKIWPAKDLEKIKGGHGIMLDDIAASFHTLIFVLLLEEFNILL
jgi:phosphatidylglycerophosphatase A